MIKKAYLAGGCSWGMEELFRSQPGVMDTEVGYSGGRNDDPNYYNHPGHAETLEISYDSQETDFRHLLDFFFRIHDPTKLNRQGNDVGESYRSAIFYQNQSELEEAKEMIEIVNQSKLWDSEVVTSLEQFSKFWPAEYDFQDYLQKNPGGYTCHYVRRRDSFIN